MLSINEKAVVCVVENDLGSKENPYKNVNEAIEFLEKKNEFNLQSNKAMSRFFEDLNSSSYLAMNVGRHGLYFAPFTGSHYLFRGENSIYDAIKPSILRLDNIPHYFLNRLKFHEFKRIISQHDAVKKMAKESILGCRFVANFEGLAQHYGIPTHHVDFTRARLQNVPIRTIPC